MYNVYVYLSTSTFLCWLGAHPLSKPDSIYARTLGAPAHGWDVLLRVEKPPAVAVASVVVSCLRVCVSKDATPKSVGTNYISSSSRFEF